MKAVAFIIFCFNHCLFFKRNLICPDAQNLIFTAYNLKKKNVAQNVPSSM